MQNFKLERRILLVYSSISCTCIVLFFTFTKGSFKNYVDKMRWLGGVGGWSVWCLRRHISLVFPPLFGYFSAKNYISSADSVTQSNKNYRMILYIFKIKYNGDGSTFLINKFFQFHNVMFLRWYHSLCLIKSCLFLYLIMSWD